jgi:predicted ribosome quality control (RQC) complex YloA/Tae2 family protein
MRLFKSWTMKTEDSDEFTFSIFDEVGRNKLDKSQPPADIISMQNLLVKEKRLAMVGNHGGKSKKFFNRKRKKIIDDLNRVMVIPKLIDITNMENIGELPPKNKIDGVKLNFREKEHFKRRDEVFTKIKKLKKAKGILELRLKDTELSLTNFKDIVEINNLKPVNPVWRTQKNIKEPTITTEKSYKLFINEEYKMGIGTSAVGNDQLRSEWAKKTDFWFHLDGDRSPHIILKMNNSVLSQEALTLVASAMGEFSQFNYEEVNLVYTQVKNLKGVKGSAGTVIFKKEKRIRVQVNSNWRDVFM